VCSIKRILSGPAAPLSRGGTQSLTGGLVEVVETRRVEADRYFAVELGAEFTGRAFTSTSREPAEITTEPATAATEFRRNDKTGQSASRARQASSEKVGQ
jgi:hypothetical protein